MISFISDSDVDFEQEHLKDVIIFYNRLEGCWQVHSLPTQQMINLTSLCVNHVNVLFRESKKHKKRVQIFRKTKSVSLTE